MTSEEKKLLQAKHRLEEAQARDRVKGSEMCIRDRLDNLEEYLRRKLTGHD